MKIEFYQTFKTQIEFFPRLTWVYGEARLIAFEWLWFVVCVELKNHPNKCCICGLPATNHHMSMMGQIPFFVCEKHYKETFSAVGYDKKIGMNRMGLMYVDTNEWAELIEHG